MSNILPPKKRLFVCCDGTFNDAIGNDDPLTNVSRISQCIADNNEEGVHQVVYYQALQSSDAHRPR
jgi:uncharacterized protein (DUF2235 family)